MLAQIWNELTSPEKWVVIVWMAAIVGAILMHISGVIIDHVLDPFEGHAGAILTIAYLVYAVIVCYIFGQVMIAIN